MNTLECIIILHALSTLAIVSVSRNGPEKKESSTKVNKCFTLSKIHINKPFKVLHTRPQSQRNHICSSESQKHSKANIEQKQNLICQSSPASLSD